MLRLAIEGQGFFQELLLQEFQVRPMTEPLFRHLREHGVHGLSGQAALGLRHVALWNAAFLPSPELTDLLTAALRGE